MKPILFAGMLALYVGCQSAPEPPKLGVRNAHAMVYDAAREVVLLYGGADERQVWGDTWAWQGDAWQRVAEKGPPPRTFPAMAYDSAQALVWLFGGNRVLFGDGTQANTYLADLWAWDGVQWRLTRALGPAPRAEAAMAYDPIRQQTLLFGGYHMEDGQVNKLGDTWIWENGWQAYDGPSPSPRNGATMAYDPTRQAIVLFGGSTAEGASGETWLWDGATWSQLDVPLAPARFDTEMAYDEATQTLIRFGGWDGTTRVQDTWQLAEDAWLQVSNTGPSPRNHSALVWDAARRQVVLFGGHNGPEVLGDMWAFTGEAWQTLRTIMPQQRIDNGH